MQFEQENYLKKQDENSLELIKFIKKTIKKARETYNLAFFYTEDIRNATESDDRQLKNDTIKAYVDKYGDFIRSTSVFTGVQLVYVNFTDIDDEMLNEALMLLEGIVFIRVAMTRGTREGVKNLLKKELKRSGILTDKQLELLDNL